jgi:PST family polysaccharide transporter
MNLKQKAIKGVIWSAVETWGHQVFSLIVFFVLARLLDPQDFGLIALANTFLAFVGIFLDQGFSQAIIQRKDLDVQHLDTAFWTNNILAVLLAGTSILCANWVAALFKEPDLAPVICWMSLSFVLHALCSVQGAVLQRELAFKALALRSVLATSIAGVVGVGLAWLGAGVWSLIGQYLISAIVRTIVLWWVSDWKPHLRFSKQCFNELFSFGLSITGSSFVNFINRRSDDFLIGYFLGSTALGYYSVAYKLLLVTLESSTRIIDKVAVPSFSKLQLEPERMREAFYKVTQLVNLFAIPCFLGMTALAPEIIIILFGEQWKPSIPVMQILALVGIVQSTYILNSSVLLAMGKPAQRFWLGCLFATITLISFSISVRWGIVAVAIAYVFTSYLLSPISLLMVGNLLNIKFKKYFNQYLVSFVAGLAMFLIIIVIKYISANYLNSYLLILLSGLIGVSVYLFVVFLMLPSAYKRVTSFLSSSLFKLKNKLN